MTWNFAKRLPTIAMDYKAIPDPEPPYPRDYYPTYPIL